MLGILIGFGIGFAGALLLAPEKKERQWTPSTHGDGERQTDGVIDSIRERVREAVGEARQAKKQAERDMLDRYERSVGRRSDES